MWWSASLHVNITLDCIQTGQKSILVTLSMARILLTGFEPFGDNKDNISENILKTFSKELNITDPWLQQRKNPNDAQTISVTIEKQLLSVDETGSVMIANRIGSGSRWDAVIHMGLCESCESIRFETRAQSMLNMRIPDNNGRQLINHRLGDEEFYCDKNVVNSMQYPPIEGLMISHDAGAFICNETYYYTLKSINQSDANNTIPACFVHFPREQVCSMTTAIEMLEKIIARLLFKPTLEVVGAVLFNNNKIMLARRNINSELAGFWEFPGGKVEHGESHFSAICREMKEEFNWTVRAVRTLSSQHHSYPQLDINLHLIEIETDLDEIYDNQDSWTSHDKIDWFEEIKGVSIAPADENMANDLLKTLNAK